MVSLPSLNLQREPSFENACVLRNEKRRVGNLYIAVLISGVVERYSRNIGRFEGL